MGAPELLAQLAARGLRVDLAAGDRLQVSPASALTDDDRTLIRTHRVELLALLSSGNLDPDRCCWPHSQAMNTGEMDVFSERLQRCVWLGLPEPAAEALADRLVLRDRQRDERHSCLECSLFRPWRCTSPQTAGRQVVELDRDQAVQLQRCRCFQS